MREEAVSRTRRSRTRPRGAAHGPAVPAMMHGRLNDLNEDCDQAQHSSRYRQRQAARRTAQHYSCTSAMPLLLNLLLFACQLSRTAEAVDPARQLPLQRRLATSVSFQNPVVDDEQCYEDLLAADIDGDMGLTSNEYVRFVYIHSNFHPYFAKQATLTDLPPSFALAFNLAACSCTNDLSNLDAACKQSCTAAAAAATQLGQQLPLDRMIDITGTDSRGPLPTDRQILKFFNLCRMVYIQIHQTLRSTPAPTPSPTKPPTPSPTIPPTKPTIPPPVAAPTPAPISDTTIDDSYTGDIDITFKYTIQTEAQKSDDSIRQELLEGTQTLLAQILNGLQQTSASGTASSAASAASVAAATGPGLRGRRARMLLQTRPNKNHTSYTLQFPAEWRSRRLSIAIKDVTIDEMADTDCVVGTEEDQKCVDVTSTVTLSLVGENADAIRTSFGQAITKSIQDGGFAAIISNPETKIISSAPTDPVVVSPSPQPEDEEDAFQGVIKGPNGRSGIATPVIIGIAVAAFAAGLFAVGGLYAQQKRRRAPLPREKGSSSSSLARGTDASTRRDGSPGSLSFPPTSSGQLSPGTLFSGTGLAPGERGGWPHAEGGSVSTGATNNVTPSPSPSPPSSRRKLSELSAATADIAADVAAGPAPIQVKPAPPTLNSTHQQHRNQSAAAAAALSAAGMHAGNGGANTGGGTLGGDGSSLASSDVSSSQAGSSGWSSSAGMSSINTGSENSSFDLEGGRMASLAAMGIVTGGVGGRLDRHGGAKDNGLRFIPAPTNTSPGVFDDKIGNSSPARDEPVTRNDLNAAIEAGDWAAVGATAALLASSSTSENSSLGESFDTNSMSGTGQSGLSSIDAERTAELDRLVDTGDWEGVVLAASKFETGSLISEPDDNSRSDAGGQSVDRGDQSLNAASGPASHMTPNSGLTESTSGSIGQDEYSSIHSGTTNTSDASSEDDETEETGSSVDVSDSVRSPGASTHSPSANSAASETPSKIQKRAEIRAEVESLVRRVVPDEIENVDEMMTQFKGREEELVETLRTMQERSIAQRERAARNRTAKREAKMEVRRARKNNAMMAKNGVPGGRPSSLPPRPGSVGSKSGSNSSLMGSATAAAAIGAVAAAGSTASAAFSSGKSSSSLSNNSREGTASLTGGGQHSVPVQASSQGGQAAPPVPLNASRSASDGTKFSDPKFDVVQASSSSDGPSAGASAPSTGFLAASQRTVPVISTSSRYDADESGNESESDMSSSLTRSYKTPRSMDSSGITDEASQVKRARYALEQAIEAGDWEAVGEAAALMSDNSVTSADTSELRNITSEYDSSGYTSEGTSSRRSGTTGTEASGLNARRASELDVMIEKGDWEGVVLAAKGFSRMDSATKKADEVASTNSGEKSIPRTRSWRLRRIFGGHRDSKSNLSVDTDSEVDSVTKKTSDKALQEEQDALAQAEIWMAIAAQSKQEGSTEPTGASDAADWAISRSLSALQAEQKASATNNRKGLSSNSSMSSGTSKGDKSV